MSAVDFFVTPGYGDAMLERLHYSQAVRIGDRIETSGQGGWDNDFKIPESLESEIEQTFANVGRTLDEAGASWSDVVHINSYHLIEREGPSWEDHNAFMAPQFLKHLKHRAPIWTQTGVTSFGLQAMRIEIRVTAIVNAT